MKYKTLIASVLVLCVLCLTGCSYTHTQTGTSHFRAQVAGVDEEHAALSADVKFDGYAFEFKGDPLALGLRVVNDVKTFIGNLFPALSGS